METVIETLSLLKRQADLETAMKQPGGVRITEEQELHLVRLPSEISPKRCARCSKLLMRYAVPSRKSAP